MDAQELKEICLKHVKWVNGEDGAERANLSGADLSGADLYHANLLGASLSGADLSRANLSSADLSGADLYHANLLGASLSRADLSRANLSSADLSGADLSRADLSRANLSSTYLFGVCLYGANLSGANLSSANLSGVCLYGANLSGAKNAEQAWAQTYIVPEGSIIGWKKARIKTGGFCIVKLRIPEDAKRSNATGRKCRAEFADVLEVIGADVGISDKDNNFEYRGGSRVISDSFDENRWDECSHGIHFFITRTEAENYDL